MPEHQWIEKMKNIAKRNIFGFVSFRSGLNIIIYYFKGRVDARSLIKNNDITISYITALEVLGYWNNTEEHNEFIKELLSTFKIIYSNERILKEAIELKRNYKLSTPDSIIGATSIIEKIPLLTGDKKILSVSVLDTITFSY